jgi:hypothetical protein
MSMFDLACEVAGVRFDAERGMGNLPDGAEISYKGAAVEMTPETYLSLVAHVPDEQLRHGSIEVIARAVARGEPLGQPTLKFDVHEDGSLNVTSQEGRHRMIALQGLVPGTAFPVHVFVRYKSARHLDAAFIDRLREGAWNEDGTFVPGPLFGRAKLNGIELAGHDHKPGQLHMVDEENRMPPGFGFSRAAAW